jgi:hypothetical protein
MQRYLTKAVLLVLCVGALCGCATTERRGAAEPQPVRNQPGKGVVVLLALSGNGWNERQELKNWPHRGKFSPKKTRRRRGVVLPRMVETVQVLDARGNATGSYFLPVSAGELILEEIGRELAAAGYRPVLVRKLPERTAIGLDVTAVVAELEQSPGLFTLEGSCDLRIRVEHWRGGSRQAARSYRSTVSGRSIENQHLLPRQLLDQAVQELAAQAVAGMTDI